MQRNKIERLKAETTPFDWGEKIESLDMRRLDDAQRFYLKNYGIYHSKLAPDRFMLRVRFAGGRIELSNLRALIGIAKEHKAQVVLTARAQLELHDLHADNVLSVWRRITDEGMTTLQTLTDNFRNIVTDPYDGCLSHCRIETYPLIEKMQSLFLNDPKWMGMLPRKFNTAICGNEESQVHFYGNDLYFALARKQERWGFNLYWGGKNSETAKCADIFVVPDEVPEMFRAVATVYLRDGLRGTRAKTRLFHLIETIGEASFRKKVIACYGKEVCCAGETAVGFERASLWTRLRSGKYGYCVQSRFGTMPIETLESVLAFAQERSLEVRIGIDQNMYLIGLDSMNAPFFRVKGASQITACAGSRYCALSLWNIKEETAYLPLEKIESHHIQVGFSGCLKGCGRHHHCDIGLVGLRTNLFGETQKAARVFLGGQYSTGKSVARLIFPSVPLVHLSSLLEKIIEAYEQSEASDFESFTALYLNPHSTFFVMLWFLAQLYLDAPLKLEKKSEAALYDKLCQYETFPVFEDDENYLRSIKTMMHALWDDA